MEILKNYDRELHPELFEQMFRGRASVFHERLNWPVTVCDGLEIDYYDRELEPAYILDVDERGTVRGSLRLLPTTAETMITREFLDFFDEPVDIIDPLMWECTKFCVHDGDAGTSVRLLLGLHDLCTSCGIERIIGLYELQMERVYARLGWTPERFAKAKPGFGNLAVGIWTVDEESHRRLLRSLARRCST
ncbi:Acyl-homoserine-lactone synthase [Agrobacterium tumefaciens str. Kerr 14]|uniref:Acyl-homoserine-lactone synthase n=1 Tax=Agrobacterium tumefaciens str. Kerr 14 TaxID=1183424 RepID=A0A1S7SAS2_AGRTU|nr:acyl-homoserine-lactone synthase [Agrobacterium tumefaciens]CUX64981.1 Acyl-homoserine-lactone synthase [Agrobacterium tumefaciens str. Kerr 14]